MVDKLRVGDIIEETKSCYDYLPSGRITKAKVISVRELSSVCGLRGNIRIRILEHADKKNIGEKLDVNPRYFDLVKRKNSAIVIYQKGNEVIALDKFTGRKATAKCSPEDEFNFSTGAKIAFNRLIKPELLNTTICITMSDNCCFTVGKIYEVRDGRIRSNDKRIYPLHEPLSDIEDLRLYFSDYASRKNGKHGYFSGVDFVEVVD